MATASQQTMACRHCGAGTVVKVFSSVNAAEDPELSSSVRDGSLFVWQCPHCGSANLISAPFMYHDPGSGLMIWLSGGDEAAVDRARGLFSSEEALQGYTARIVDSVGDLIEKVKIFDAGLDDAVMEICKYVTRMEMGGDVAGLKFLMLDGADHELTLAYPKDGDMQMLSVGFNVYEDAAAILRRNPSLQESTKGLVRIDEAWVGRFFG